MEQPTYKTLIEKMERLALQGAIKAQTVANRVSVLRSFLKHNKLSEDDPVGHEMRTAFRVRLTAFADHLSALGKPSRTVTNSLAALRPWREVVVAIDTERSLSGENLPPFNLAFKSLMKSDPVKSLGKHLGIPSDMMYGWLKGKKPRLSNLKYINRVENYFGVPAGDLAVLAGLSAKGYVNSTVGEPAAVPYREWLAEATAVPFYLKPDKDSPLRAQWLDFMRYKTGFNRDLRRSSRGAWRLSAFEFRRYSKERWYEFLNQVEVPTAKFAWAKTSSYLGWLALPKERGGLGIPESELQTMAWFAVADKVETYMNWRLARNGGRYNGTIAETLALTKSLTDSDTGYLTQQPELLATLPTDYRERDWAGMCQETYRTAKFWLAQNYAMKETTRDPKAPFAPVLELANPMDAIVDLVQRIRASRPIGGSPRREAIWARDLVLIKVLISNPLRKRNIATLTWREDNTGQLYQRSDSSWWIRVPKRNFKNARGAAGDNEYDMPVQEMVWADLERYLRKFRPLLLNSPSDYVFIAGRYPAEGGRPSSQPWESISDRVEALTKKYLWRCAGVGTHAFRHLVATSIIKASGLSDFKTAAIVLNDRLSTVEKHYAHLKSGDGAARMSELLGSSFKRM